MAGAAENRDAEKWRQHVTDTKSNFSADERARVLDPSQGKAHPEGVRTSTKNEWQDKVKSEEQDRGPRPATWKAHVNDTRPSPGNDNQSQAQASWKQRVRPEAEKPNERSRDESQQKQRGNEHEKGQRERDNGR